MEKELMQMLQEKLDDHSHSSKEQSKDKNNMDKISYLENEVGKLAEKLKTEQENVEKLKKTVAEEEVARSSFEAAHSDLAEKLQLVAEDRDNLERKTSWLQSQVQLKEAQRSEMSGHYKEVESQLTNMKMMEKKMKLQLRGKSREISQIKKVQRRSDESLERSELVKMKMENTILKKELYMKLGGGGGDRELPERTAKYNTRYRSYLSSKM